jgi:hypothetical protein
MRGESTLNIEYSPDGKKKKCIYFVIYLYVFKLVCTRWENFIRIGITVLHIWRVVGVNCGFDGRKYPFYWLRFTSLVKLKSTIDTSNSSNTVLLFLNCNAIMTWKMTDGTCIYHCRYWYSKLQPLGQKSTLLT